MWGWPDARSSPCLCHWYGLLVLQQLGLGWSVQRTCFSQSSTLTHLYCTLICALQLLFPQELTQVSTPVVFARSTRRVSPCFSTWTIFRTNSCPSVSSSYGVTRLHFGTWYLILWARILGFFWCCQALSNYLMMKLMCNIPGACKSPQAHLPLKWFHEYHQIGQDPSQVFLLLLVNSYTFLGW